jgi:hypothetical protein
MTTGRINQVTVLRARQGSRTRQRVVGLSPFPRPEFSHRPIQVVPPAAPAARHLALSDDPSSSGTARVPSPPISHASETLPQSIQTGVGPFGEDYRRAAAPRKRAAGTRRISDWLAADRIGPRAIKSTSLLIARNSVRGALHSSTFQAIGQLAYKLHKSQATKSHPKRAHPARQAHQPLGPRTASRPPAGRRDLAGAESTPS